MWHLRLPDFKYRLKCASFYLARMQTKILKAKVTFKLLKYFN